MFGSGSLLGKRLGESQSEEIRRRTEELRAKVEAYEQEQEAAKTQTPLTNVEPSSSSSSPPKPKTVFLIIGVGKGGKVLLQDFRFPRKPLFFSLKLLLIFLHHVS